MLTFRTLRPKRPNCGIRTDRLSSPGLPDIAVAILILIAKAPIRREAQYGFRSPEQNKLLGLFSQLQRMWRFPE